MARPLDSAAGPVVLWEDDPVRRPLIAAILEAAGFRVSLPRDAESAMALVADSGAAALVLAANVTRPSGAEFLRELRHQNGARLPPTVALLQPGQAGLRSTMRELGVRRLLSEPFDPRELVAAVLDSRRAPGDSS
jgi:DNA-binding response OmpR family regulator